MTEVEPLLEVGDLSVSYRRRGTTIRALDSVSFEIARGEAVGLVGESGSGKSTLAQALLGLVPVENGSVRFLGQEITNLPFGQMRAVYREMQIVFQDPYSSLNPARTIAQTLAEPLRAYGQRDRGTVRERVGAMLERVQLPRESMDRYPSEFSGGQRQRIAIARALMLSPQLLICDEALSALDLSVQAQILNLLAELQPSCGLSYLFISHDLDVVRHMCSRVIVLYRGQVMESGRCGEVTSSPAHPYTQALLDAAPVADPRRQRARPASRATSSQLAVVEDEGGCPFAARCPHVIDRCRSERPELRSTPPGGSVACHRYAEWRGASIPRAPAPIPTAAG